MQGPDYESIREVAIHCKKEGVNLGDLTSVLRIRNYIKEVGIEEERVEQFIARFANSHDPQKLVDVLQKIGHIGLDQPLEELEEHIKQRQVERATLQHEIDEARTTIDGLNIEKQIIQDYKELKNEMDEYGLQDPRKFLNVLRVLKKYKHVKRIMAEFSFRRSMKKEGLEIEFNRHILEGRIKKVKDVLPLAEQLIQFRIGIGEILAFHSAVIEKADVEKIPLETAAYRIAEDIRDYRQLGGFKREHDKAIQQICMLNAVVANKQQAIMALFRLQSMGITEDQILNMVQQMNNVQHQIVT